MREANRAGGRVTVGIDLGTTYSAVARIDEAGRPVVLPNREGDKLTPSVVFFDGERPVVGAMARRAVLAAPLDTVQFVKRSMGDPAWRFETAQGSAYRPEEISALILKRLAADASRALGGVEVDSAVVTVPAYFDDAARRATIDAGTIAGLEVRRVLNEPTAAALAYGLRAGPDASGTILVYDLGGGTFDVTVMRVEHGDFRVLATHGDRNLGGFDFDNALMRWLDERYVAAGGTSLLDDETTEADLRERAELAKHTLSTVERTVVPLTAGGVSRSIPVTRAEFEGLATGLLGRTRDLATLVLEDAGLRPTDPTHLLLAGGSTRMPMVRAMLGRLTGLEPAPSANAHPDEIVAQGAAVQAALLDAEHALSPLRPGGIRAVHDVTSHGLGALYYERDGDGERVKGNRVVIPANTPIPATGKQTWKTIYDRQTSINWDITQGDDEDARNVRILGRATTSLEPCPKGTGLEVSFEYDSDQLVRVAIYDSKTGRETGTFTMSLATDVNVDFSSNRIRSVQVD